MDLMKKQDFSFHLFMTERIPEVDVDVEHPIVDFVPREMTTNCQQVKETVCSAQLQWVKQVKLNSSSNFKVILPTLQMSN